MWLLYTLPLGANRSKEEVRARTLVGALESIRCGITCVQDMLGLIPLDDANTDVVIEAYREIGLRVVFSPMVWDVPPIAMVRDKDDLPPDVQEMLGTTGRPVRDQLDYLEHQFRRHPAGGTLHWALAPFAPQRCTPAMLQGCAELAAEARSAGLHPRLRDPRAGADRARAVRRSRRLADHLHGEQRPAESAAQHRAQRLDLAARDGAHGGGRRRHRAQPPLQHEAQERHRAGLRSARGRRAARAWLRQLQRLATCRACSRR